MQLQASLIQLATWRAAPAQPASLQAWALGTLLDARVIAVPRAGAAVLAIDGRELTALTARPLAVGEQLRLQVDLAGPAPRLRVLRHLVPETALSRTVARLLPTRAAPDTVREFARALTVVQDAGIDATAPRLRAALANTRATLVAAADVQQTAGLKNAVLRFATPTEARVLALANHAPAAILDNDPRVEMQRLATLLHTSPAPAMTPTAARPPADTAPPSTRGADASSVVVIPEAEHLPNPSADRLPPPLADADAFARRVLLNQVTSASAEPAGATVHVELPLVREQHIDLLELDFERRADDNDSSASNSSVTLQLELDDGRDFCASLHLRGDRLNLRLGSHDPQFNAQLAGAIGELEDGLARAGLCLNPVTIAPLDARPSPALPLPLIDARA